MTDFKVTGQSGSVASRSDIEDAVHEAADKIIAGLKGGSQPVVLLDRIETELAGLPA